MSCLNTCIEIDLDHRDEYVHLYDDNKIHDDLHQYIMDYHVDIKGSIMLKVNFNYKIMEGEKHKISEMLRRDFQDSLTEILEEIKKLNDQVIFLTLLGLFFLAVSFMVGKLKVAVVSEVFLLISWVLLWEVVESFLFTRRNLNYKKKKYLKLLTSEIIFNEL